MSFDINATFGETDGSLNANFKQEGGVVDAPIQHVQLNGVELPIVEKTVNVITPTTEDIEDAINEAKDYTDERIINLLPTDEVSGAIASFPDGADDVPIISLNVAVEPVQDLHGYDVPWPAGGGKNLVNIEAATVTMQAVLYSVELEAGQYALSATVKNNATVNGYLSVRLNGVEKGTITVASGDSGTRKNTVFTLIEDGTYDIVGSGATSGYNFEVFEVQLEKGSAATAYAPYENVCPISGWTAAEVNVNGETITHEFVDELGNTLTVYGGEDEVVGGKLRVTRKKAALLAIWNWQRSGSYPGGFYVPLQAALGYKINTPFICSHAKTANKISEYVAGTCYCDQSLNFRLMPTDGSATVQDWKDFITAQAEAGTPIEICYKLATPLEYDLTPTEVKTLLGDNTIFADCGDVEVTYKADIAKYIEKRLGS